MLRDLNSDFDSKTFAQLKLIVDFNGWVININALKLV